MSFTFLKRCVGGVLDCKLSGSTTFCSACAGQCQLQQLPISGPSCVIEETRPQTAVPQSIKIYHTAAAVGPLLENWQFLHLFFLQKKSSANLSFATTAEQPTKQVRYSQHSISVLRLLLWLLCFRVMYLAEPSLKSVTFEL